MLPFRLNELKWLKDEKTEKKITKKMSSVDIVIFRTNIQCIFNVRGILSEVREQPTQCFGSIASAEPFWQRQY